MSNLKVGDIVFYKGDEGIIREVMTDGKENFYRVDVSRKSILYLYEDELDLGTQKLNDNQKIVFDFLKNEFKRNDLQYTLWSFTEDVYERLEIGVSSLPYVKAWGKLKEKQHFEVLAAFAQWGLEQEE